MASIYKRKSKDGKSFVWRVVVRVKGFPTACKTFERKQEAEDWGNSTEREIKSGQFRHASHKKQHTYAELLERIQADGVLEHHRSFQRVRSQFAYWQERFGAYALVHLTSELICSERQRLLETPTPNGTKRSASTVNRYMAVLASTLSYATKRLHWLADNPCSHLLKLKVQSKRDRILTEEEAMSLLQACRFSKSPYLYCIVLIALTTGARRGEILALEWQAIDFENRRAYLKETKNGRPRTVALAPQVFAELEKIYQNRNPKKPLVFASAMAFGKIDIKKAWQSALKQATIIDFRFHDLRHTFATYSAKQGASNLELATAMGHRTLEMLQRYTHLDASLSQKFTQNIANQLLEKIHE